MFVWSWNRPTERGDGKSEKQNLPHRMTLKTEEAVNLIQMSDALIMVSICCDPGVHFHASCFVVLTSSQAAVLSKLFVFCFHTCLSHGYIYPEFLCMSWFHHYNLWMYFTWKRANFVNTSLLRSHSCGLVVVKIQFLRGLREGRILPSHPCAAPLHCPTLDPVPPALLFSCTLCALLPRNFMTDCSGMFYPRLSQGLS